jgi:hypothetical protein
MSEHGLHGLGSFAELQHEFGKGMPEIMDTMTWEPGSFQPREEMSVEIRRIERSAVAQTEHEPMILIGWPHQQLFLGLPGLVSPLRLDNV